jgi:hypothetical protein
VTEHHAIGQLTSGRVPALAIRMSALTSGWALVLRLTVHLAVWVPSPQGLQSALIEDDPATYFKPPYVGSSGWIGIELDRIRDEALEIHIRKAWDMTSGIKKKTTR